jgi:hypothetical protein
MALVTRAPYSMGIFGQVLVALAAVAALRRMFLALWCNERYWFTLRRWGMPVAILLPVGEALKVLA